MQQDSFDDTRFLSQCSHLNQARIGISTVLHDDVRHPRGSRGSVRPIGVFLEQFDLAAGDRDIHNTNPDVCRKVGHQGPAKIVGRTKTGGAAAQGRDSRVPVTLCSAQLWKINRCQDLKAIIHRRLVLLFNSRKALHVGLAKAEEDEEVRILSQDVPSRHE